MARKRNRPYPQEDLEAIRQFELKNDAVLTDNVDFAELPKDKAREYVQRTRTYHDRPEYRETVRDAVQDAWFGKQAPEVDNVLDNWAEISQLLYFAFLDMARQIENRMALNRLQRELKNNVRDVRKAAREEEQS